MKTKDAIFLKDVMNGIKRKTLNSKDTKSFYANCDLFNLPSLQEKSFANDIAFFDDINFILSVIISIISHPHILNKGEEIILRSELVSSLSNDMFLKTLKDSSLWKHNKEKEKIPEYVYYYQHVDNLKIYENIFIVYLINLISNELNKESEFYSSMISTIRYSNNDLLKNDHIQSSFEKIDLLQKKLEKIKSTFFYKSISKGGNISLRQVTPTNILLKDRLYNYCFKFYRKLVSFEDLEDSSNDFKNYFYILFLKCLKAKGFKLTTSKINQNEIFDQDFHFERAILLTNGIFDIKCFLDEGINISIIHNKAKHLIVNHKLYLSNHFLFTDIKDLINKNEENVQVLSLFTRANIINNQLSIILDNLKSEQEMISDYIDDLMLLYKANKNLYLKYCPYCKSNDINEIDEDVLSCNSCRSSYTFLSPDELWFLHLRRN